MEGIVSLIYKKGNNLDCRKCHTGESSAQSIYPNIIPSATTYCRRVSRAYPVGFKDASATTDHPTTNTTKVS